jgi:hypothetical protein
MNVVQAHGNGLLPFLELPTRYVDVLDNATNGANE